MENMPHSGQAEKPQAALPVNTSCFQAKSWKTFDQSFPKVCFKLKLLTSFLRSRTCLLKFGRLAEDDSKACQCFHLLFEADGKNFFGKDVSGLITCVAACPLVISVCVCVCCVRERELCGPSPWPLLYRGKNQHIPDMCLFLCSHPVQPPHRVQPQTL